MLYGIRVNTSPLFPMIDACGADGQRAFGRLPLHHSQRIIRIPYEACDDCLKIIELVDGLELEDYLNSELRRFGVN